MRRASAVVAVAALAVLGLAACGGGGGGNGTTAAQTGTGCRGPGSAQCGNPAGAANAQKAGSTVSISTPSGSTLAFDQKSASAKAGNVTIDFDNKQALQHDVKVEDSSGKELGGTDLVSSGTATATVNLTAGTYTFFCSVPGHREAGMEGTLTVK
jgi:plastocyanin